jgi:hypothetical protein
VEHRPNFVGVSHSLKQRRTAATVGHHPLHLKATTRWAHRQGLLDVLLQFDVPKSMKGAKIMRGRALRRWRMMPATTP